MKRVFLSEYCTDPMLSGNQEIIHLSDILYSYLYVPEPINSEKRQIGIEIFGMIHMHKFIKLLAIIISVWIGLTACGGAASGVEGKTVIVTPAVKGNSASLDVGDTLEVRIPTIPTTGYEWTAQELNKAILVQERSAVYVEDSSPSSAGGIVTLTFKAVGAGKTTLNLLYVNSSSNNTPSISSNSFSVTVEVK